MYGLPFWVREGICRVFVMDDDVVGEKMMEAK
jgi:hypothetical protein